MSLFRVSCCWLFISLFFMSCLMCLSVFVCDDLGNEMRRATWSGVSHIRALLMQPWLLSVKTKFKSSQGPSLLKFQQWRRLETLYLFYMYEWICACKFGYKHRVEEIASGSTRCIILCGHYMFVSDWSYICKCTVFYRP